ncbi:MAG: hypothetical protein Fur007_20030 [Rhodoferax sp.]
MATIPALPKQDTGFDDSDLDYPPLTREQAQAFRQAHSVLSPWAVLGVQCVFGLLLVALAGWVWDAAVGRSVAWGVAAVVLPAALFARGLMGGLAAAGAAGAVLGFFVWEFVKIVLTIGMLVLAYRVESGLNWPAMLVGLILTLKVVWVALALQRRASNQ